MRRSISRGKAFWAQNLSQSFEGKMIEGKIIYLFELIILPAIILPFAKTYLRMASKSN
jgi:hypothetical protein